MQSQQSFFPKPVKQSLMAEELTSQKTAAEKYEEGNVKIKEGKEMCNEGHRMYNSMGNESAALQLIKRGDKMIAEGMEDIKQAAESGHTMAKENNVEISPCCGIL
jgi:hypothetical protein